MVESHVSFGSSAGSSPAAGTKLRGSMSPISAWVTKPEEDLLEHWWHLYLEDDQHAVALVGPHDVWDHMCDSGCAAEMAGHSEHHCAHKDCI